jgi:type VI secretion system secreted protein VgrG
VLDDNSVRFEWRLKQSYPQWVYCVQYGETDLDFVSRLLEHAGIFYWHEHGPGGETLILGDHFTIHVPVPGYEHIAYYPPDAARSDEDHYFG